MFETSVIQGQPRAAGGRLSLLTISIIAHSAVIIGAVAFSIASVDFPVSAPDEFAQAPMFLPVLVPPPLGVQNGGAVKPPEPIKSATPPPQPQPNQITAPGRVPDTLIAAATPSTGTAATTGGPHATSTEPLGVPWGTKDSLGSLDAPPGVVAAQPMPEKIYEASEVIAPVPLFQPRPAYPQVMLRARMNAVVGVRCVIDQNGHVRDAQVTLPSGIEAFNKAVVTAVQQWRYKPGSLNGQAVDSYLDLTVRFSVN
jgi:protein TonB